MSYVYFNKESTVLFRSKTGLKQFATKGAAKAAFNRAVKDGRIKEPWLYDWADAQFFFNEIEKKEVRHGIVGSEGKEFVVGVNTPWTSGPWSETYWCS